MASVNVRDKLKGQSNPLASGIGFPITPNDSTDITDSATGGMGVVVIRGLIVGGAGNVVYQDPGGVQRTIALPAGGPYPIRMARILLTSTTATSLVGIA